MKRAALILAVGLALMSCTDQTHHAAQPAPSDSPVAASQSPSAALAALAPALPTPAAVQARRRALRPTPASRSRSLAPVEGLPAILVRIRGCESGDGPNDPGDYSNVNPESGASGAFQFLDSTWHYVTHLPGKASNYSRATQDWGAIKLYRSEGTTPWNSSRYCWA